MITQKSPSPLARPDMFHNKFGADGLRMLCILFAFSFLAACGSDGDPDVYNPILTATNEAALGNALEEEALSKPGEFPILRRSDFTQAYNYLDQVAYMVSVKTKIRDKFDWRIHILENDAVHNAFTLPGGKIFVTTGLLKYLDSEHQLLALIAHEAYYADRIDQTGQDELSLSMYYLKESDAYATVGTRIFMETIQGNSTEASNMIHLLSDMEYDPFEVLDADRFYLSLICENYLYSSLGIKELMEKVANDGLGSFQWFENKPPVPSSLFDSTVTSLEPSGEDRIMQIQELANPENCGAENTLLNMTPYNHFVEMLP